MVVVIAAVWLLNLPAILMLARHRPWSALDMWLLVVMSSWLFDVALSAMLNAGRYDLGFYAGRIYGLLAASFVLMVMLHQNGKLYHQLHLLREGDRAKAAELHRLSTTDQLTGVANRRAFDEAIGVEWRRMMRHGMTLSLLLIDVDFFKRFNDAYGHVAGDQCLRAVGQVLTAKARRAGELAARYGGEEFAILLPHVTLADARKLGEVICAAVREQNILHEKSEVASCVTVSIGAASISDLPELAAQLSRAGTLPSATMPGATVLIEMADQALYQAKMGGRNRVIAAGAHDDAAAPAKRGVPSVA
jgi:diguanylate cyclase (GGDEF)-like protein